MTESDLTTTVSTHKADGLTFSTAPEASSAHLRITAQYFGPDGKLDGELAMAYSAEDLLSLTPQKLEADLVILGNRLTASLPAPVEVAEAPTAPAPEQPKTP